MVKKRNLVLGAVRGYNFEQLRPFVVSLQRTAFEGDLVLLWNNLSDETLNSLDKHGVKLVHFSYRGNGALNSWSRFWQAIRPVVRLPIGNLLRRVIYKKILNLAFVRYIHALEFLEASASRYNQVLLTDVRDVIFQDDPFRDPLPGNITAFLEAPHMMFGCEPMNDDWIKTNYGAEMTEKVSGNRISCCGTVMGTATGIIDYLRVFIAEIMQLKSVAHGADTSVHNVLVHDVLVNKIAIAENFHGAVGTMSRGILTGFLEITNGYVSSPKRLPVPVLHQYDRNPEMAEQFVVKLTA